MNEYGERSTPELSELQQLEDEYGIIRVPVKVTEVCEPIHAHTLPNRHAVTRSVTVTDTAQQIVGGDLRRRRLTIWGEAAAHTTFYVGTRLDEVEQNTAALWPAMIDDGTNGASPILVMEHTLPVWVKASGAQDVTLSFIAEYWAD